MPALFRSVRLRNRFGRSEAGRQLLRWFDGHHPVDPQVLDAQIPLLIQKGLYAEARALMERSWLELGRTDHLHHLLFRRGARPKSLEAQITLFETLANSAHLPLSYRAYCRVVCAYRAAELNDPQLMRASIAALDGIATGLEDDPNTRLCRQGNRFNRTKLLVSCYATTLRLQLTLSDRDGAASLGRRALRFTASLDLTMIETDTSFRLTRNLMRVLAVNIVEAWATADADLYWSARQALQTVHDHAHRPEHDEREVQEDHRAFAVQVMARVVLIDPGLGASEAKRRAVEDLMLLLFRAKIVSEAWRAERLPGVLPSFQAFLSPSESTPVPESPLPGGSCCTSIRSRPEEPSASPCSWPVGSPRTAGWRRWSPGMGLLAIFIRSLPGCSGLLNRPIRSGCVCSDLWDFLSASIVCAHGCGVTNRIWSSA